jgi:hypothetical protein
MPILLSISTSLIWFGPLLLVLGVLGLTFSPFGRREIRRIALTGLAMTVIGAVPQLAAGALPGAAYAMEADGSHSPVQAVLLSGMTSQIVYETYE